MKQNIELSMYFHDFLEVLMPSLTSEQSIELIKEIDAYHGSWDFTHKILVYVLSVISEDPKDYEQFIKDMKSSKKSEVMKILERMETDK